MAFLQNIRAGIGRYFLKKESTGVKRHNAIMNLSAAKNIGILYNADNINDVELVKKYIAYLKDMGKKVKSLGYVNRKEVPGNINNSIDRQCFAMNRINWYYKPASGIIDSFVKEEYDMLFDLNIGEHLPLLFVAALSRAKCKVGKYSEKYMNLYDVMIETDEEKTLKYFLKNVDTYMEMLNKKSS